MRLIYYLIGDDEVKEEQKLTQNLPQNHLDKASEYQFISDKLRFLAGRNLLIEALDKMGKSLDSVYYDEKGKPHVEGISFSISHSERLVVLVLSDIADVGVDVEFIREIDVNELSAEFNEADQRRLKAANDVLDEFFQIWTAKESVMKADGRGFYLSPKKIQIDEEVAIVEDKNQKWFLQYINLATGYKTCVCSTIEPKVKVEQLRL
ncbi:4'-phosphopantetheinyl transferase superfamily protein [Fulvivirga sp. RKSG066]|uniref:4'-phosphopantetheinyl transferase family protein n=1 Tax=Fulvivirga aurantia TaxID=2529383 RepID=UPI0012BC80E6|nr:4'-phosphopantetheinyl transferase superfamily protein [Fulvivirga aurantia]MTI22242.1 4'-phosphopantetheinyl transferase superfamily protein [Fulvivirga aurantia]